MFYAAPGQGGIRKRGIPMQSFPWVGTFSLSLEPVMTAHWIHTSNPYGTLLSVSILERNAEGKQKWHTLDCSVPPPSLAEGINSNPTACPCRPPHAMGRHGLRRLVSPLTAKVIYKGDVQVNGSSVAFENLLLKLSHVVLSALRFNDYCRLVLPSSVPILQFL